MRKAILVSATVGLLGLSLAVRAEAAEVSRIKFQNWKTVVGVPINHLAPRLLPAREQAQQSPGAPVVLRSSTLTPNPVFSSSIASPDVASQGNGIFVTHNWSAARSVDNGQTWQYFDPFTAFPNSPAAFSAGLCCNQRLVQDPQRNLIFWSLQYLKTGSTASSTNGVRLAVTSGSAGLESGSWQYRDIRPGDFGSAFAAGAWLDYVQIQLSSNYLYITSNIFSTTDDAFKAAVIGRIPLAALQNNTSYTMDTFVTANDDFLLPVKGATSTMYIGSVFDSNSIRVFEWPESNAAPTTTTIFALNTTSEAPFSCPGPDGLNSCGLADTRMQTGWLTTSELGFMWSSSQDASHPYPFTRVAILNPSTRQVIAQPDISSAEHAYLYPSIAPNGRGHLGGIIDRLGGSSMPALFGLLRDDFSNSAMNGWETVPLAVSDSGTDSRWGYYNGAVAHERYPNTWLLSGHTQSGGSANNHSKPQNFWLTRQRDVPTATVEMLSPTPGTTFTSPSVTFTWSSGGGVDQFHLYVGSTPGGYDIYDASQGTNLSRTVTGLPSDGRPIYVTLWAKVNGVFSTRSYNYTAADGRAAITSPAPGTTLPSSTATFSWSAGANVTEYYLYVGSSMGGYDLYEGSQGLNRSKTVTALPTDGRTIHVRLWSRIGGTFQTRDFTFVASSQATSPAVVTTPTPGTTFGGSSVTFGWSTGSGVTEYYLYVGSTPGGYDLYEASQGTNLSKTVTGLPTDGRTIHVRLWSRIGGMFQTRDFTFVAASQATSPAAVTTPTPGTTFSGSSVTFGWSTGSGVTEYYLYVGSTPGGYDIYEASQGTNLSKTVNGLPTDGRNIYITLFSRIGGVFSSRLYSFRAAGGS
jgi:hypothetical protein